MFMLQIIALCFVPLVVAWVCKICFPHRINWLELATGVVATLVVIMVMHGVILYGHMRDFEIINGYVLGKDRVHSTYEESYSCNCRTNSKGESTCDTCYRTHYTVTWKCKTTVGDIVIDHSDSLSRLVYSSPDPRRYKVIVDGEPVAIENTYKNYIKGAESSLFNKKSTDSYLDKLPPYPRVYDFYRINRIVTVGNVSVDIKAWNDKLSSILKTVGPNKQANVVVVLVEGVGQDYTYALEAAWLGGKKNDIVAIIGLDKQSIQWTSVLAWTNNELFKVQLRDALFDHKTLDLSMIGTIAKYVSDSYVRKPMEEFEYLEDQIELTTAQLIMLFLLSVAFSSGLSYYFYRADPFST